MNEVIAALIRGTPLLITGLAVALAFRAGIWNIGAEGQFYAGAVAAAWIGTRWGVHSPLIVLPLVMIAAGLAGALWAAAPALLRARFGVLEVITTIMLNFVAEHLVSFLVQGPLQESGHTYPQTDPIAAAARLAPIVPGTRLSWAFPLAVLLAVVMWVFFERTRAGFALRATGANPIAARIAGRIPVTRVATTAFLVSGAIAGLAGAAEVSGVTFALYERLSPGYGYTAIAVALLAGLHPLWIVVSALFFGALEAGAAMLQRTAGIPSVTVYAIEAAIILALVVGHRVVRRADA
ncbi:MAG: ABC transporter permease [Gemmatimonadales bacterium]|nr:ABC transporter permease [Gemmatimonadales bacterium]